ncbi:hypothetical protein FQN60_016161 [Etheostoma spectabile]|uniref:Uncharacterized protein n=1 Tax=Etheostoma spectabile TaxID=54343 RepID=A0A5J5D1E1_9PERO|nr:hypothetical protein FQN60_016161 [Etheostoma spectabile]
MSTPVLNVGGTCTPPVYPPCSAIQTPCWVPCRGDFPQLAIPRELLH